MSIDDVEFDLLVPSSDTPAAASSFLESLLKEERVPCDVWELPSVARFLIAFDVEEFSPSVDCFRCRFCRESKELDFFSSCIDPDGNSDFGDSLFEFVGSLLVLSDFFGGGTSLDCF